jgi:hypothetical protein
MTLNCSINARSLITTLLMSSRVRGNLFLEPNPVVAL